MHIHDISVNASLYTRCHAGSSHPLCLSLLSEVGAISHASGQVHAGKCDALTKDTLRR